MDALRKNHTGALVIDVQSKLFPKIENGCQVIQKMELAIKGLNLMKVPVVFTEQYPQGLGSLVPSLQQLCEQEPFAKTTFSCLEDAVIKEHLLKMGFKQWILMGLEAHVCVLQTAKSLRQLGYEVAILNDAISSRSIYDYSTAIGEMRDLGVRITSTETVLFELIKDSKSPEFKQLSELIKWGGGNSSGCCHG